jgi:(p)ppGpp synthase/HD superfamily hydrolase
MYNPLQESINWCITRHKETNHMYDTYLPYEFHLRMVATVADQYMYLTKEEPVSHSTLLKAAWGHDLIEDTRTNFNEVRSVLGAEAAEIIYAVTNEKGKKRKERANDAYYAGIRNAPGAVFVKLCDRIANVQYTKMIKSQMFKMYDDENNHFLKSIGFTGSPLHSYYEMIVYLTNLFIED